MRVALILLLLAGGLIVGGCGRSEPQTNRAILRTDTYSLSQTITAVGSGGISGIGVGKSVTVTVRATRPTLALSRVSGGSGARVRVTAHNCPTPSKDRDTLAWHDHYYQRRDVEKRPPLGVWRRIPVVRTSPTILEGVFIVRRSDHLGRGILDAFCGGPANAVAIFTVTR